MMKNPKMLCNECACRFPNSTYINLIQSILLLYTDRTHEYACEISVQFKKFIHEFSKKFSIFFYAGHYTANTAEQLLAS